ncbi:Protein kinase-like domain superfamily protein [Abortiporus biennis]
MERAQSVGVPVPIVRRVVGTKRSNYLVMDRVEGETLEQSWSRLGLWKTVRVAWQLRSFLQALRTVTSQTSGGLSSGRVRSEWFGGIYMPVHRASPEQFTNYINWWLIKCRPSYCQSRVDLRLEPPPQYFLVHQDLAPRNMIFDQSGKLWLLDWGRAGYYPEYMEYFGIEPTAMPWLLRPTWAAWWGRLRWSLLRWIAWFPRSSYKNTLQSLRVMRQRSNRFRLDKTPYSENE